MKLYHGSTEVIERIDLSRSKPNKDFGKGFYLSDNLQQAKEMAAFKAEQMDASPIITVFEFDEKLLHNGILQVKEFDSYCQEWAEFIFANRNNPSHNPVHDYDIVVGPIANDRVGIQIRHYMEHDIDLQTFLERLKYMKGVTFQYFFGIERAIEKLIRI